MESIDGVVICKFNEGYARCEGISCWNCKSKKSVAHMTTNPYLGSIFTCVECGDRWSDGEAWERPFKRGWRQESIKKAKAIWGAPDTMSWDEAVAKQQELWKAYFGDDE